jgi:hypothetical protein
VSYSANLARGDGASTLFILCQDRRLSRSPSMSISCSIRLPAEKIASGVQWALKPPLPLAGPQTVKMYLALSSIQPKIRSSSTLAALIEDLAANGR